MNIELKPRIAPKGAWNAGQTIRGDREIWVAGEKWGHVKMVGHGCHGPSYEFRDANGFEILENPDSRYPSAVSIKGQTRNRWGRDAEDKRTTEERIIDKAKELIADKKMRSPAVLAAEQAEARKRFAEIDREADAHRTLMRDALVSLAKRDDLSNSEREGLAGVFRLFLHEEMPS